MFTPTGCITTLIGSEWFMPSNSNLAELVSSDVVTSTISLILEFNSSTVCVTLAIF